MQPLATVNVLSPNDIQAAATISTTPDGPSAADTHLLKLVTLPQNAPALSPRKAIASIGPVVPPVLKPLRRVAVTLTTIASLTLIVGLFAPSYTVYPTFGDQAVDAILLNYLPDLMAPHSFSIASTIRALVDNGDLGIASILLLFSILFPATKMALLFALSLTKPFVPRGDRQRSPIHERLLPLAKWFLETFGHWSMLEVFVVAVIVVGFKSLPMGATIIRQWGLFCFAVSVVFSMIAASLCKRLHHQ
jgi:hypothetical protein